MRVVIGCLAAVGLAVVLLVAGCVGLIGFGVASAVQDIPPYATRSAISQVHAADLALIDEAIRRGAYDHLDAQLSPAVVALYRDDDEVLKRQHITGRSYTVINGGGVGTLTTRGATHACVVLSLDRPAGGRDVLVFFVDRQKPSGAIPVERP